MVTNISNSRKESIGDQQESMAITAFGSPGSKPELKAQTAIKSTGLDIGQQQEIMGSNGTLVFRLIP